MCDNYAYIWIRSRGTPVGRVGQRIPSSRRKNRHNEGEFSSEVMVDASTGSPRGQTTKRQIWNGKWYPSNLVLSIVFHINFAFILVQVRDIKSKHQNVIENTYKCLKCNGSKLEKEKSAGTSPALSGIFTILYLKWTSSCLVTCPRSMYKTGF